VFSRFSQSEIVVKSEPGALMDSGR